MPHHNKIVSDKPAVTPKQPLPNIGPAKLICDLILQNRPGCHIWYFEKYVSILNIQAIVVAEMQLYTRSLAIYSHSRAIYSRSYRATRGVWFITSKELMQGY